MRLFFGIIAALALASCASPQGVIETNPGVFTLSANALGIEGGEAAARTKALRMASDYCSARGSKLDVQAVATRGPAEWGSRAGSADITFLCRAP